MRQICEVLGFNKSTFYYQPKSDPSEDVLRAEIQQLAAQYPTYGYRRIRQVLLRLGYTVGYKRVARLMKEENLSASVKRVCQTTRSFEGPQPWVNRVQRLEISRVDQVWVGDITYVRLKRRFIYVAVLMDIFTRMIRGWQVGSPIFEYISDVETATRGTLAKRVSGDTSFRSRGAISFNCLSLNAQRTRY